MLKKEDWMEIKAQLDRGVYLKDIALELGVHPKTISRAVKRAGAPSGKRPRPFPRVAPFFGNSANWARLTNKGGTKRKHQGGPNRVDGTRNLPQNTDGAGGILGHHGEGIFGCHYDHPHIRGEHLPILPVIDLDGGSSPHPWGTRGKVGAVSGLSRFIPTSVGNTLLSKSRCIPTTVHPHTRGEHTWCSTVPAIRPGSSPHPWGTRVLKCFYFTVDRFIPTPVGNTSP